MMESCRWSSEKFSEPLFNAAAALAMSGKRVFEVVMLAQIHRLSIKIISECKLARHLFLSFQNPKGERMYA